MRRLKSLAVLALALICLGAGAQEPLTVLVADTVLDGKGAVLHNTSIVVSGTKIVQVGGPVPKSATVYHLKNLTVTPGLIDTHEHIFYHFRNGRFVDNRLAGLDEPPAESLLYAAENGKLILESGFTTIQTPGPGRHEDIIFRDAVNRGILAAPRILTSLEWFRFDPPGTAPPPEQLRAMVRQRKAEGADFIKIFASSSQRDGSKLLLTQEQMNALCDEANKLGLRTLVHAYTVAVKEAAEARCTTIEHGIGGVDKDALDAVAAKGMWFDPTIGIADQNYITNKDKFIGIGNYTPQAYAKMEAAAKLPGDPQELVEFRQILKHGGIKLVFGTDAVAGSHGNSAEALVYRIRQGGQLAMDALEDATWHAAQSLRLENLIGAIAPGMEADIIAMDGDFLKDPGAAQRVVFVMKGGKVFKNTVSRR